MMFHHLLYPDLVARPFALKEEVLNLKSFFLFLVVKSRVFYQDGSLYILPFFFWGIIYPPLYNGYCV